jgi:hypothetical protein
VQCNPRVKTKTRMEQAVLVQFGWIRYAEFLEAVFYIEISRPRGSDSLAICAAGSCLDIGYVVFFPRSGHI